MNLLQNTIISCILLASTMLEASPYRPSMMKGSFNSCLEGICHLVSEIFFIENDCFNNNKELGIYYYLNKKLHIAQLTDEYKILKTNCTMSSEDEIKIDDLGLYNFINDPYDIVYLIIIAAAKIIIGVLCCLHCKKRKIVMTNKARDNILNHNQERLQSAQERTQSSQEKAYSMLPSAPPMPTTDAFVIEVQERTIPETRGSALTSTCVSDIYPSFTYSFANETKSSSCTCHATVNVCTNCSCVRNKRPCNAECHNPKNGKKIKRTFKCVNKYN
jgi:hypothetical protein